MSSADRIAALVRHNVTLIMREPGPAISRIVLPIVLILIMRPLFVSALGDPARGTAQLVVGMLVMFSLLGGVSQVGHSVLVERSWRTFDRLRATPVRPVELLLGKALPLQLSLLVQQVVVLGFGVLVFDLRVASYGLLALSLVTWTFALLCVGSLVATLVRSHDALSAVADIGGMVFTCLGGAAVPLAAMPVWARAVAPASPGYWAMRGLRAAVTGDATTVVTTTLVVCCAAAVAAGAAGLRLARGWGRERLL